MLTICVACMRKATFDPAAGRHVRCLECWTADRPPEMDAAKAAQFAACSWTGARPALPEDVADEAALPPLSTVDRAAPGLADSPPPVHAACDA